MLRRGSLFDQIHLPRDRTPRHEHLVLFIVLNIVGTHPYIFQRLGMYIAPLHLLEHHQTVVFRVVNDKGRPIRSDRVRVVDLVRQHLPLAQRVCDIVMIDDLVMIAVRYEIRIFYLRDICRYI